ncbi:hypothetical protein ES703_97024 [subsurface metagenome]
MDSDAASLHSACSCFCVLFNFSVCCFISSAAVPVIGSKLTGSNSVERSSFWTSLILTFRQATRQAHLFAVVPITSVAPPSSPNFSFTCSNCRTAISPAQQLVVRSRPISSMGVSRALKGSSICKVALRFSISDFAISIAAFVSSAWPTIFRIS